MSPKKSGDKSVCVCVHAHIHTHAHMHAHTLVHTYTHTLTHVYANFLDKSNGEKNQVSTGQVSLV